MTRFPLVLVCIGGVAAAQPVTHPEVDPCRVTVVLAPDEVRTEIEAWVRAEPRCQRELEVRVVPTEDGGLYLQARDRAGRVRERVVPDAQSAAVLVVSWMADDSTATPALAVPQDDHAEILQPPTVQVLDRENGIAVRSIDERPSHRWLTLGALASERGGFRGQLDLFGGAWWTLGIAGGWRHDRGPMEGVGQARVVLGTERSFGRISLRAQIGLGFDTATQHEEPDHVARVGDGDEMDEAHRGDVVPTAEAGVFAKLRLSNRWGLFGGPLIEANQEHPTISVFLGVQRGL